MKLVSKIFILVLSSLSGISVSFADCSRIISLAPSISETLYELELGENLIAVSNYDVYPAEVKDKARIGGFLDLNLEGIISLKPSLIIGLKEHSEFSQKLISLRQKTLLVDHSSIKGIIESLNIIGDYCHKDKLARLKSDKLRAAIKQSAKSFNDYKPTVLVAVGRNLATPSTRSFFISGRDGFYEDLIELAGAKNIIQEKTIFSATLSAESLIKLNPDIIIEIIGKDSSPDISLSDIKDSWSQLSTISAVKSGNIHIIKKDYADIPGPRFILLLKDFVNIISSYK